MSRLSEKTIDELNDKVNFTKAFSVVDSLYEARSHLSDEVINDLRRLVKKLDEITEGYDDEDGDELFDFKKAKIKFNQSFWRVKLRVGYGDFFCCRRLSDAALTFLNA